MTRQIPDYLILCGKTFMTDWAIPLPKKLEKYSRIVELSEEEQDRRLKEDERRCVDAYKKECEENPGVSIIEEESALEFLKSSACRRRWQGIWEVIGERLYIRSLYGRFNLIGEGPLEATWFSGVIHIPVQRSAFDGPVSGEYCVMENYAIGVNQGRVTISPALMAIAAQKEQARNMLTILLNPGTGGNDGGI